MPSKCFSSFVMRFALCVLLLAGGLVVPGHARAQSQIMVIGDSLVAGYGLERGQSLPVQLQKLLIKKGYSVYVANLGVSGSTTSSGPQRLKWAVSRNIPKIVIIALGANDLLRGVAPEVVYKNLDAMLKLTHEKGYHTILVRVTAPPQVDPAYAQAFNAVYTDLGSKYNVPVYPFFLDGLIGNRGYMLDDGVHPNSRGVAFIAHYLSEYIISTNWLPKPVQDPGPALAPVDGAPAADKKEADKAAMPAKTEPAKAEPAKAQPKAK